MAINWFRWFGGRSGKKEVESRFPASEIQSALPNPLPREEVLHAALRDTAVIHGADKDWIRGELVTVNSQEKTTWDVRLVVSGGEEMDVWERAEAFQSTFLQQLRALSEGWDEWLPAVTWKFTSQDAPAPLQPRKGAPGGAATALQVATLEPAPKAAAPLGLSGELVV